MTFVGPGAADGTSCGLSCRNLTSAGWSAGSWLIPFSRSIRLTFPETDVEDGPVAEDAAPVAVDERPPVPCEVGAGNVLVDAPDAGGGVGGGLGAPADGGRSVLAASPGSEADRWRKAEGVFIGGFGPPFAFMAACATPEFPAGGLVEPPKLIKFPIAGSPPVPTA